MSRFFNRLSLGGRPLTASAAPNDHACWGQATAVFAATGELGQHASSEPTPRLGLANLARALYAQGTIPAPMVQALGPSSLGNWGCPSTHACSDRSCSTKNHGAGPWGPDP
jgi:hypothetical protein